MKLPVFSRTKQPGGSYMQVKDFLEERCTAWASSEHIVASQQHEYSAYMLQAHLKQRYGDCESLLVC